MTSSTLRRLLLALLATGAGLAAFRAPASVATGPMTWVQSSFDDFSAGELVSVSLRAGGELGLAPTMTPVGNVPEAYVWAVGGSPDGAVFVAAGTEGRVYRFAREASGAEPEVFFDTDGAVHAMAVGADGNVYVAASPDGRIWRLPADADAVTDEEAPFYTTESRYVWSLAIDDDGTVYAGTGDDGSVHRVDVDGNGDLLYDSGSAHVTSLALDADGNLLAGTSDDGHLYRIGADGDVFVLFDAPLKQITGIVPSAAGVYFSALEQGVAESSSSGGEGAASSSDGDEALRGAVYLQHEDGFIEQLWGSGARAPYALVAGLDGVIVGTGSEARLLSVTPGPSTSSLADADAEQVTALAVASESTLVGTSNLGRVYRLLPRYRDRGEFVSQVKDTATLSRWGRLRWRGEVPAGASIRLFSRSGNTAEPDETWSDWSGAYEASTGSPVTSPSARFIQWKAELERGDDGETPTLGWVELVYVQRNLRPEVAAFTVHPAGVIYRQNSSFEDSLPIGRIPSPVRQALDAQQGRNGAAAAAGGGSSFLGQAFYLPGSQTFTWDATDANGDRMHYSLWYRGEAEEAWKPIAEELLGETIYLWDTTAVPDGVYRARIVASDAPSNPAGEELQGARTSQPLVVDNTPPRVDNLSATVDGAAVRVTGRAVDETSLIHSVEYAVDGGEWHAVLPADGLPDAAQEGIGFRTMVLEPGEHTIIVRVTDAALNGGTGKVVVSVEQG